MSNSTGPPQHMCVMIYITLTCINVHIMSVYPKPNQTEGVVIAYE